VTVIDAYDQFARMSHILVKLVHSSVYRDKLDINDTSLNPNFVP